MLEKMFHLKENHTTAKTEVLAGITTFMTMAYILAVNPSMLAAAGMDKTAVLMATCIASFIGSAVRNRLEIMNCQILCYLCLVTEDNLKLQQLLVLELL